MKHIRRNITFSVLGTMLFVFAVLLATVNIFIPEYLTSEARKAILAEAERNDTIPFDGALNEEDGTEEHFLTPSVRYLEVYGGLTDSEHLSKSEYHRLKPLNMRTHIRTFCMWMSEQLCNIRLI